MIRLATMAAAVLGGACVRLPARAERAKETWPMPKWTATTQPASQTRGAGLEVAGR